MTIIEERIKNHLETKGGPRYLRISRAICQAIDAGEIQAGEKLPTHRALAEALGVSVQTISFAYAHADQEGYVHGKVGSGTYVSHHKAEGEAAFLKNEVNGSEQIIDLSIACAIAGEQQQRTFEQTLSAMATDPDSLQLINAIKPFAGLAAHRQTAQIWLRKNGLEADMEQICICNGATHGLLIAMSSLVKPGGTIACETLVDHGLISLARTLNFKLEGVAIDAEGMLPEALEQCCQQKQLSAVCVTPSMHNPTTATMSEARRQAIAEVAQRYNLPLVEDDVFGPLESNRQPPVSSFYPDNSYYITSFSKTLASGLRVGYLVPPKAEVSQVIGRLRASTWMASPMTVEIASRWIALGTADQLIAWHRQELNGRQRLAASILAGQDYLAHPEGPLLWLALPEAWRAETFIAQARARNVSLTAAEPFVVGHQPAPHAVRISLASATSQRQLRMGLNTLAALLREAPPPAYRGYEVL